MSLSQADIAKIKVTKTQKKGCSVVLEVEAPVEAVSSAFQTATVQVQSRAQLPGFRAGKVPLAMVRQNFDHLVRERAMDIAVRDVLNEALTREKLHPVATPAVEKLEFEEQKPLKMTVELEIPPVFDPKNYTGAKVVKTPVNVGDAQVEEQVKEILEHNARLEDDGASAVGPESFVIVDCAASKDGKDAPEFSSKSEMVDMAAPQSMPGLADAIKGAKKGETREFTTELEKTKVSFKVTVCEIKKKVLPALDEAFVKEMGFDTPQALRDHIKSTLLKSEEEKLDREVLRQIEEHLIKENTFDIPGSLVEHHVGLSANRLKERVMPQDREKINEEQEKKLKDRLRPVVEHDIRIGYIVHAIAGKEKLEATAADFEEELAKGLARARTEEEKGRVRSFFEARQMDIMATITERKVMDFLKAKANVLEA